VVFDDPELHLPGTSGAPVVDEAGELVGMVVRFRELEGGGKVGIVLPAGKMREQLLAAPRPAAPKKGLWARLFG
jgi:CBS domain-containing protein